MIATLLGTSPAHAATVNVTVSCTANTNFTANDGDNIVFTFSSGCTNDSQLFTWKAWITNGDWLTPTSVGVSIPSGTQLEKTLVPGNSYRNAGDTVAFVFPDTNNISPLTGFQIIWQGATPANSATPTISSHPTGSTKTVGTQLTLSVVATASDGGTLTYQWKKDGNDISGAILANFTIPAVSLSDAGVYTVVVTNTHMQDIPVSTTSNSATIVVEAAPEPESPEDDSDNPTDSKSGTPKASKTASAGDITFSAGASTLSAATKNSLKATVKKAGKSASFTVTGAAGRIPGVSDKAVTALALKRASVIKSYLVSLGVKSSKITLKTVVVKQGKKPKVSVIASY